MNESYSRPEWFFRRWITPALRQAIREHAVIILTGARQVGKSTLLTTSEPFRQWRYLSMDDFDVARQAKEQSSSLWAGASEIVLDEVQKIPELLPAVKLAVDQNPGRYRFVLSGSANLLLMRQVSESLAGRAIYFVLDPPSAGEINRLGRPDILEKLLDKNFPEKLQSRTIDFDPSPLLLRGFMPALQRLDSSASWVRWWEGYVTTYLERDLRQISQIDSLVDFRRVMQFLALRTGQIINQTEVSRDASISQPTIHRYLNLLESTYLFERLPAFTGNRTLRLVKSPKAYWVDPGLAVFLCGYYSIDEITSAREYGAFFETLVYHHLRILAKQMTPSARLYFWRTRNNYEVDFVLEYGRKLLAIEVKRTARPGYRDAANLTEFLEQNPQASAGLILHGGNEILRLGEKVIALPWWVIAGQ